MKLSAQWGRVVRSPIPKRNEVYLMPGDQFEDGQYRIVIGYDVPREALTELEAFMESDAGTELGERIEHRQMVQRAVASVNVILRAAKKEGAES